MCPASTQAMLMPRQPSSTGKCVGRYARLRSGFFLTINGLLHYDHLYVTGLAADVALNEHSALRSENSRTTRANTTLRDKAHPNSE